MAQSTTCNLCDHPGSFTSAKDVARVACHVRRFANDFFTVWRCAHCRSLHSREDVDLGPYYEHYPFKNHTLDFHTRLAYRNRLRLLQKQGLKKEQTILDYGCGAGLFLQFLREQGYSDVTGFDSYVPQFASRASLDRTYDVVVSYDVIEHVDDPRAMLESMLTCLKPEGMLVLGTPNASRINLHDKRGPQVELSQPYHRHILSEEILFQLAKEYHLDLKHTYRRFYFDTLIPGVNTRFMWEYIRATGGFIDVCVQPPDKKLIYRSPRLLLAGFFGYFAPPRANILLTLKSTRETAQKLAKPTQRAVSAH